ncbi:D-alanyl-D-alanine carboxypeptidase [[Actinomadura] parvosata subsp. kistnae]|uniref:Serine hydrolase n=1 Tax=[Actinomadura] parvosata subsp. kistnae TaxID=1909395 RepID=A0A1V0AE34_9ACTN|nr:serine hydrolase domain-containing protein [Nonomuraea sp. ATCC 55076]AQZ68477.1 serine hydrolase [Nonomuraea sp. ATCC 55076]SPL93072.1 D-alanyl-D-alanine carboxypeptidase [Actinomadura parvosata subsp. kistnae]
MIATSLRRWTGASALALAVLGGTATQAAAAAPSLQATLNDLVAKHGFPAALASVQARDGKLRNLTAKGEERPPADGYVRIGSNTKTFTAVTVLQLVGEGKVKLDAPVEKYLPGLLRGKGIDGRRITVRQLLQHTSGLPEYTDTLFANGILPMLHEHHEPRQLLDMALRKKAQFAPGTKWVYTNTNYIVAGLLIEKVTGHRASEEITRRTVDKIGLKRTYFPADGDEKIRDPHPTGYHRDDLEQPMTDVTDFDPSGAWTAGQMISTPSDLNRFFTALLDGKLLKPAQLKEMRTTVAAPQIGRDGRYGLGLSSVKLSCGVTAWGHGGSIPGYYTSNAATEDGRAAAIAVTHIPTSAPAQQQVEATLDTALCSQH